MICHVSRMALTLALSVALAILASSSTHVWAQAGVGPAATQRQQDTVRARERRVTQLAAIRAPLTRQYEADLRAVDRLKQQRASWRRDRELRAKLATAKETGDRLASATRDLDKANAELASARRALVVAIDAELPMATDPRAKQLAELRAQLAPPTRTARRIQIPDVQIDPLADPEELDQLKAQLQEAEQQLAPQFAGLDKQAKELDDIARLRRAHDRADAIMSRDADRPTRITQRSDASKADRGGQNDSAGAPAEPLNDSAPPPTSPTSGSGAPTAGSLPEGTSTGGVREPGGLRDATVVLADVLDAPTIDSINRAQRSGDPAQRAAAAKKARDAVAAKRALIQKKLREIEELKKRSGR